MTVKSKTGETKNKKGTDLKNNETTSFDGVLSSKEFKNYNSTIKEAMKLLGKKNFGMIIHGGCFPSLPDEDTGIGSPYNSGASKFINFIHQLGFNCVQLGPSGKTKCIEPSPYASTIFSSNTLFIDLKQLTEDKWLNILSVETHQSIIKGNKKKNSGFMNYEYIFKKQDEALREAWKNYKDRLVHIDKLSKAEKKQLETLQKKFEAFKYSCKDWLNSDALYEVLGLINGNEYWIKWKAQDKNLPKNLISEDSKVKAKAEKRLAEIYDSKEYLDEMEFYKFTQFIVEDQKDYMNKTAPVHSIADIQVTYSDRDWWAYQDLFLEDFWLGVPPDYFSSTGQAWGFPVLDPGKMFKIDDPENKKYGDVAKLIKLRFDKMFRDNPGGVRIDHIIGLIDPWVYPKKSKTAKSKDGGRRLYSSPQDFVLKKWSRITIDDVNLDMPVESTYRVNESAMTPEIVSKYSEVVDIIIQAAKDNKVELSNIICEDLGTLTTPVVSVLHERKLSGIRVTQFVDPADKNHMYRGLNIESKHWVTCGTHDNMTMIEWAKSLRKEGSFKKHAERIALDFHANKGTLKTNKAANNLYNDMVNDESNKLFLEYKYAELFLSAAENVQLMFTDFLGMTERYNTPGSTDPDINAFNWRTRIPNNYEEVYFKALSALNGVNIPKALCIAIKSKYPEPDTAQAEILTKLDQLADSFTSAYEKMNKNK